MDFKIDMSKVVKIVVAKEDGSFIEYSIDNGTIVDVSIVNKETTIEEKVDNLKKNNADVKRISNLIEFDKAGILDRMARTGSESVFDTIKETVVNEPIEATVINEVKEVTDNINHDTLSEGVVDAAKIMKLEKKMDEVAKANREKIAEKVFPKKEWEKPDFSKITSTTDRAKRIASLKKMITKINNEKK